MAENTNRAKCAQMWKEIYLFKCKKNVSVWVHAREQVVKMNKMLFFILFSQSAVLRPSRLLLLSTRLLFCRGVSSLRSNACLSFAILICFNFLCSIFSFLVISRTFGVGGAFVTRYIHAPWNKRLHDSRIIPQNGSFASVKWMRKGKKYIYC